MVAHTAPVKSWGHKPCGGIVLPTTTSVAEGSGAPRPPGTGRGNPEVQTLRNSALEQAYGGRNFADLAERRAKNEQRPSHAAASAPWPFTMDPSDEGDRRDRADGVFRDVSYQETDRLTDDLGTAV